ncbi:MAG: FAD-dependent thymidylate synthase [Candidatus Woesearchaeota archaeon]|nr:FAD-dependent thymidylate synthase [Candidatus Woesearchaeota archaeon]
MADAQYEKIDFLNPGFDLNSLEAKLKVILEEYTPNGEKLVAKAANLCYSGKSIDDLDESLTNEKQERIITQVTGSGHLSVLEHISYSFLIDGISRACSHELVRHRIASYSQQSQRYVNYAKNASAINFVVPPEISENPEDKKFFLENCANDYNEYVDLVNKGYFLEDARYLLPNAASTRIMVTMNARELLHFFELRTCERAQWEIRDMAKKMLKECYKTAPIIFETAGPECISSYCTQGELKCKRDISEIKKEFKALKGLKE